MLSTGKRLSTRPICSFVVLLLALSTGGGCGGSGEPEFLSVEVPCGAGSEVPNLHVADDVLYLTWAESGGDEPPALRFSVFDGAGWTAPAMIAEDERLLVNWADFPSLAVGSGGALAAHWLKRQGGEGFAYDAWFAVSDDGGAQWTPPVRLHRDSTATDHGFVTLVPGGGGFDAIWLDGRETTKAGGTMKLMHTRWSEGRFDAEAILDADVCTCCQTDALALPDGLLVAYRDHQAHEVRDISVVRWSDGAWSAPATVHRDGWRIAGCPVNGPALAGSSERVALAWFTGADDDPRVLLAYSTDAGGSFGPPLRIDDGQPLGRVDVEALPDGSVVVSWMEQAGDRSAEIRLRRVEPDLRAGPSVAVGATAAGRPSGFPRLAVIGEKIYVAWTDPSGVSARIRMVRGDASTLTP